MKNNVKKQHEFSKQENLTVIPYVRNRLIFAQRAAQVVQERIAEFDVLVVDLPYFLNGMLELPIKLFPLVSSLMIRKKDSSTVTIPFTPVDAACAALSAVMDLRDKGNGIDIQCIDDSNAIDYIDACINQPVIKLPDDYYALNEDLDEYFNDAYVQLDELWGQLPEQQRFYLAYRTNIMVGRLKKLLEENKRILFICEYRSLRLISKVMGYGHLPAGAPLFPEWRGLESALVLEDPNAFWKYGLLDDVPAVVLKFFNAVKSGELASFDKLKTTDRLIAEFNDPKQLARAGSPSISKILLFHRYLRKRLIANMKITPYLDEIYDSALACAGDKFARALLHKLLDYPCPDTEEIVHSFVINEDLIILEDDIAFEIPDLSEQKFFAPCYSDIPGDLEERAELSNKARIYLTRDERKLMIGNRGRLWALESEYQFFNTVSALIRDIAKKRNLYEEKVIKSYGSIGDGIHWKRSIFSKITGEDMLYIKKKGYSKKERELAFNEYTPIVYLFPGMSKEDDYENIFDANITQRNMDLKNLDFDFSHYPPPDYVYSIYYTYKSSYLICDGHIVGRQVTSAAFLYTKYVNGLLRYDGITRRPEQYQCRVNPQADAELQGFAFEDRGIAWAIKYASDAIIVVAKPRWKPSKQIQQYAISKNVSIIQIPLTCLAQEAIEKFSKIHFISTPLKKHPSRFSIVKRYIGK